MEIISERIKLSDGSINSSNTQKQITDAAALPTRWVCALFAKLHARYGHKWSSSYPEGEILNCALQEWSEGLAGYTGDEIREGLNTWKGEWPPSLHEFKHACRLELSKAAAHKPFPSLPAPTNPMDKTRSLRKFLDDMRAKKAQ